MTFLVERLAEPISPARARVGRTGRQPGAARDRSHSAQRCIYSLFLIAQLVIDIAGELVARRGRRFENDRTAIANLDAVPGFTSELVEQLVPLAGFCDIVVHEYISINRRRVFDALHDLGAIERFLQLARHAELNQA